MKKTFTTTSASPTTVLVGLSLPSSSKEQTEEHLNELAALAITRGIQPIATFVQQLDRPNTKTWIGSGKVEEIATFLQYNKVDSVLFDDELSPGKVKNLSNLLQCKVWDRTLLILEIFVMRAKTAQAKTQVELAQYQYLLPRLTRMWTHLSRQKGGAGMQGTGEKELETDRRIVQKKIHLLKKSLNAIEKQIVTQGKRRKTRVNVALVGYTNAGKSTLMQLLSKSDTLIEDKLFATLSTTVRKVVLKKIPFLISDTVGFIRKLPHTLIECFKSTLAEVCKADFLLHVVDFSYPNFQEHIKVVQDTLEGLGVYNTPMILVFNKVDKVSDNIRLKLDDKSASKQQVYDVLQDQYKRQYGYPVAIVSSQKKYNLQAMYTLLYQYVAKKYNQLYPQKESKE